MAGKVEEGEESELGRGVLNELQALQLLLFERRVCLAHIFVSVFLDALRSGCINPISQSRIQAGCLVTLTLIHPRPVSSSPFLRSFVPGKESLQ